MAVTRVLTAPVVSGTRTAKRAGASATVDVWRADLAVSDAELARLSGSVQAEEVRRASKFRLERDRRRFLAARGVLRHILAGYAATEPRRLTFGYGAHGKPFLVEHADLHFNISHTADVLLVGVARGRRLGVDVEATIPDTVIAEVIGTVASEPERRLLATLAPPARREWFMRLWTRKEAYIKGDGRGMSLDLRRIDVLSLPDRPRVSDGSARGWEPERPWMVRDLALGPGLAAALVADGPEWHVAHFNWRGGTR